MKKSTAFWILSFVITVASAYYQRRTGPTYPIRGKASFNASEFSYALQRSHGGETDCPVQIKTNDPLVSGTLEWKRHGVDEAFVRAPMAFSQGGLSANLPHQPPAGRLDYRVVLQANNERLILPAGGSATIRFKGDVPGYILIPHILTMFIAMFLSTRTGLEIFSPGPHLKALTYSTLGFLIVGGMILGPIMQKHAFGAYWTGWPVGIDLTDNKTLIALLGWIVAAVSLNKAKRPEIWTALAAVLLLAAYMIPHSVRGSELKYGPEDRPQVREGDIPDFRPLAAESELNRKRLDWVNSPG